MSGRKIQITQELYDLLVRFHLYNDCTDNEIRTIALLLEQKEEARQKRMWYAAMHDPALDEDQRQAAKEMYQDIVGVPPDFRY